MISTKVSLLSLIPLKLCVYVTLHPAKLARVFCQLPLLTHEDCKKTKISKVVSITYSHNGPLGVIILNHTYPHIPTQTPEEDLSGRLQSPDW